MNKKLLLTALLSISMLVGCTSNKPDPVPPGPVDNTVYVTGVTLDKESVTIKVGETAQLTPTVSPSNATNKAVTWEQGDTNVASVDSNGLVTGVKAGQTAITVKTVDGDFTAVSGITVTDVVKKTYLRNTFNLAVDTLYGNASSMHADADTWDDNTSTYYDDFFYEEASSTYTIKEAADDMKYFLDSVFDIVDGPKKIHDEGYDQDTYVITYYTKDGKAKLEFIDYEEEGDIYVQIQVGATSFYEIEDDIEEEDKVVALDFTTLDFTGNLYDATVAPKLISFMNEKAGETIVSSIDCTNSQIMSIDSSSKTPAMKRITIGSAKNGGNVRFNFNVKISSIKVTACAYYKYIDFSGAWNIDNAKMFINSSANDMGIVPVAGQIQDETVKTFTFDSAVNFLNFYNEEGAQRTFLLKLEISYK